MGKSQRTKGATFEREIAKQIGAALGLTAERNLGQARDGGNDITIGQLVIECKRRKSLKTLMGWLAQADAAAVETSGTTEQYEKKLPFVVARQDNDEAVVILSLADFLRVADHQLGVLARTA
jgi:hypothetical protein